MGVRERGNGALAILAYWAASGVCHYDACKHDHSEHDTKSDRLLLFSIFLLARQMHENEPIPSRPPMKLPLGFDGSDLAKPTTHFLGKFSKCQSLLSIHNLAEIGLHKHG